MKRAAKKAEGALKQAVPDPGLVDKAKQATGASCANPETAGAPCLSVQLACIRTCWSRREHTSACCSDSYVAAEQAAEKAKGSLAAAGGAAKRVVEDPRVIKTAAERTAGKQRSPASHTLP